MTVEYQLPLENFFPLARVFKKTRGKNNGPLLLQTTITLRRPNIESLVSCPAHLTPSKTGKVSHLLFWHPPVFQILTEDHIP